MQFNNWNWTHEKGNSWHSNPSFSASIKIWSCVSSQTSVCLCIIYKYIIYIHHASHIAPPAWNEIIWRKLPTGHIRQGSVATSTMHNKSLQRCATLKLKHRCGFAPLKNDVKMLMLSGDTHGLMEKRQDLGGKLSCLNGWYIHTRLFVDVGFLNPMHGHWLDPETLCIQCQSRWHKDSNTGGPRSN